MTIFTYFRSIILLFTALVFLSSCQALKYKPVDAKEYPPEPEKRVQKNLEEGKGFRLFGKDDEQGGNFDFASANPLWRASLETIDFLPLMSANYSGGIIISDWYSGSSNNESIKITIRFLSNEVRADAQDIKVFTKNCETTIDCKVSQNKGVLVKELTRSILKKAAIYEKEYRAKNKKKYEYSKPDKKR